MEDVREIPYTKTSSRCNNASAMALPKPKDVPVMK
jgi:hypothetical protein